MISKFKFSQAVKKSADILSLIYNFNTSGELFGNGYRNKIKLFEVDGVIYNIKSFKIPHFINKLVYKYFRKSKARRSFEYATILLEKGIGTPQPIAFLENFTILGLRDSYYVSEHLDSDLTFRELVEIPDFPDHEKILRQFTKFCFDLHENGIEFLDHSPGNTLIKRNNDGNYSFYLVDLNRMSFHDELSLNQRVKNIAKLTNDVYINKVFSEAYASLYGVESDVFYALLMKESNNFLDNFNRRKKIKKRLKFWKK